MLRRARVRGSAANRSAISSQGRSMTAVSEPDFDIRTATAGRTAVVLSVGASLLAIPQAFVVGVLVAVL
ncbi:MAG TPA: hypothetical protein VMP03_15495, partial [Methylomirabilota bacterium]|nr:hypothetical protein [Methylomirabilota bacterium]